METSKTRNLMWHQLEKTKYPITQALLPVTVLIWGSNSEYWIGEVTSMAYTYVVKLMLLLTFCSSKSFKPIYSGFYYKKTGSLSCQKPATPVKPDMAFTLRVSNFIGIVELNSKVTINFLFINAVSRQIPTRN